MMSEAELRQLQKNENFRQNFESERWKTENKDKFRTFMPEHHKVEEKIDEH